MDFLSPESALPGSNTLQDHRSGDERGVSDPAELKVPDLTEVAVHAGAEREFTAGLPVGGRHALAAAHVDEAPRGVDLPLLVRPVVPAEVHLHLERKGGEYYL